MQKATTEDWLLYDGVARFAHMIASEQYEVTE